MTIARQVRVAAEAVAVEQLLQLIESTRLTDYSSEMTKVEIERMSDLDRRRKVVALLPPDQRIMPLSESLLDAADKIIGLGFHLADAVHLAAAERWRVDVFLSVDDRLLRRAKRNANRFAFRVLDPMTFLQEINDAIDG